MPKGEHLKGKKIGNNFDLPTSVMPTSEQKKAGWAKRRDLIKTVKHAFQYLQETPEESLPNENISKLAAIIVKQAEKAIKKADTRAADVLLKYLMPTKIENRMVDEDGNDVKPQPMIVFNQTQEEILKLIDKSK